MMAFVKPMPFARYNHLEVATNLLPVPAQRAQSCAGSGSDLFDIF